MGRFNRCRHQGGYLLLSAVLGIALMATAVVWGVRIQDATDKDARVDAMVDQSALDASLIYRAAKEYVEAKKSGWPNGAKTVTIADLIADGRLPTAFRTTTPFGGSLVVYAYKDADRTTWVLAQNSDVNLNVLRAHNLGVNNAAKLGLAQSIARILQEDHKIITGSVAASTTNSTGTGGQFTKDLATHFTSRSYPMLVAYNGFPDLVPYEEALWGGSSGSLLSGVITQEGLANSLSESGLELVNLIAEKHDYPSASFCDWSVTAWPPLRIDPFDNWIDNVNPFVSNGICAFPNYPYNETLISDVGAYQPWYTISRVAGDGADRLTVESSCSPDYYGRSSYYLGETTGWGCRSGTSMTVTFDSVRQDWLIGYDVVYFGQTTNGAFQYKRTDGSSGGFTLKWYLLELTQANAILTAKQVNYLRPTTAATCTTGTSVAEFLAARSATELEAMADQTIPTIPLAPCVTPNAFDFTVTETIIGTFAYTQ